MMFRKFAKGLEELMFYGDQVFHSIVKKKNRWIILPGLTHSEIRTLQARRDKYLKYIKGQIRNDNK